MGLRFLNLYIFGCPWSSLLHVGFLQLRQAGAMLYVRCSGFLLQWPLLMWSTDSRTLRLQCLQHTVSVVVALGAQ